MGRLKKNIIANFGGSVWSGLTGVVFVPLYIHFIGVESYGLIGIYATLQALSIVLDMGISATLNREMARLSVLPGKEQEMRNLVRSLEIICWGIAILIGVVIWNISPFIANKWVKADTLSPATIEQAVRIMGCSIALQWPASFYAGGLMGLQRQVLLNAVNIVVATVRSLGAVLILWLISPTIQAFFLWQIIISITNTCLMAFFIWKKLPESGNRAHFQKEIFAGIWKFAVSMNGITITGLLISQSDKIILSKLLPLETFGYYSFAVLVVSILNYIIRPFYTAIFPRFSSLVSLRDETELANLYHTGSQFLSVIILPLAVTLMFFPSEILLFWTGDPDMSSHAYLLVRLLAIGATLNGLLHMPAALILSYGWTSLPLYTHTLAIVFLVPIIYFLTSRFGAMGAPIGWIIYNGLNMLISLSIIHSRLLKKEKWPWYLNGVVKPCAVSFAVAIVWRMYTPFNLSRISILFLIVGVLTSTFVVTTIATPLTRSFIKQIFQKIMV